MKNHSILVMFLVGVVGIHAVFADETGEKSGERKNSLEKGAWAMQFLITNNFQLTSFQGATLSLKSQIKDTRAIRIGLALSGRLSTEQIEVNSFPTELSDNSGDVKNNIQGFTLKIHYILYPKSSKSIHMYWGSGPVLGRHYQYGKFESEKGNANNKQLQKSETTEYSLGVAGFMGVEWFVHPAISLSAEYGFSVSHTWTYRNDLDNAERNADDTYLMKTTSDQKNWLFQYTPVQFGLSVYF